MNTQGPTRYVGAFFSLLITASVLIGTGQQSPAPPQPDPHDSFLPAWVKTAEYNRPLSVVDTDSALGRRNLRPKSLTLRDVALVHGHLCDGLVVAWVELGAALRELFPDGIVDRTDLRAVAKNGPCWTDAAAWTTGARVNHGTLMLDSSVGDGFIVARVSTGVAVRVSPKPGVLPTDLVELERSIRNRRASGRAVLPDEVDRFEALADRFSRTLLETPPEQLVRVETLRDFRFRATGRSPVVPRSDIINRDLPRQTTPGACLKGSSRGPIRRSTAASR